MAAEIIVVQISLRPIWLAIGAPGIGAGAPGPFFVLAAHAERQASGTRRPTQHE